MTTAHNDAALKAEKSYQSRFSRWNNGKHQRSQWSTLVAALVIALGTTTFIATLNRQADRSDQAENLLLRINGQLSQLSALEWQAIAKKELGSELLDEIQETRSQTMLLLNEVRRVSPDASSSRRLFKDYDEYSKALDKEFQLIAAEQIAQAVIVDEERVDPAYDVLSDEIANLSTIYSNQKRRAYQTAEVGSTLALTLAALVIGALFWQFNRAWQIATLALAEQKALSQSEERFRSLVQNASDVIMILNAEGVISYVSASTYQIKGCLSDDLVNTNVLNWVYPDDTMPMQDLIAECLANSEVNPLRELRFRHGDGHWCHVEVIGNNLLDNPSVGGIVLTLRDISERILAEEALRHNAFHDPLTDLPNRALFMERLKHAVQRAKSDKDYVFAVLFLDLDRFKIINDSLGHKIGDELLIGIARRLEVCLRAGDTIARLGGDEFAILLSDIKDANQAEDIASRIKQELTLPFNLNGHELFISTSIGIALGGKNFDWLDDILRNADTAMYRAKALGRAGYSVFDTAMHIQVATRLQLETDLRQAIEHQEFRVHYQPIVSLETGIVTGFEALLRWEHPTRGFISPTEFVPLAEETGLIVSIGHWVICEACRQTRAWQVQFPTRPPLTISVNLSVKQLKQPELIQHIAQILHETNLDARSLRLEITESLLMENTESVTAMLSQLKDLGILLYLDDFGTGYSSLSHLHCFPIDTLKIDRSFISRMAPNDKSSEIVRASIRMAQALGMDVIAEGVETAEQLAQLSALQCQYGQGYFFSKPLDAVSAGALIVEQLSSVDKAVVNGLTVPKEAKVYDKAFASFV